MVTIQRRIRMAEFEVSFRARNPGDMAGFLDMLRYEGGTVIDWSHADTETLDYTVRIRVEALRHQPARWQSFGLVPHLISEDLY